MVYSVCLVPLGLPGPTVLPEEQWRFTKLKPPGVSRREKRISSPQGQRVLPMLGHWPCRVRGGQSWDQWDRRALPLLAYCQRGSQSALPGHCCWASLGLSAGLTLNPGEEGARLRVGKHQAWPAPLFCCYDAHLGLRFLISFLSNFQSPLLFDSLCYFQGYS